MAIKSAGIQCVRWMHQMPLGDEDIVNKEPVHGLHDCPEFRNKLGPSQRSSGGDGREEEKAEKSIALVALEAKCKALEDALNLRPAQQHEAESDEKDSKIVESMEVRDCASGFLAERNTELATRHLEQQKRTAELSKKEDKLDNYRKLVMLPTRFLPNATGAGCERHDNRSVAKTLFTLLFQCLSAAMNVQRQERGTKLADREYTIGKLRRDLDSFRTLLLSFVQRITEQAMRDTDRSVKRCFASRYPNLVFSAAAEWASWVKDHKAGAEWASIPPLVPSTATPPLSAPTVQVHLQKENSSPRARRNSPPTIFYRYFRRSEMELDSDDAQLRLRPLPQASTSDARKAPATDLTTVYETRFPNFSRPFTPRPLTQASTSNALYVVFWPAFMAFKVHI
ncbi:hypothetical protein B0H14DRAFT_2634943 [Mycena olivaceomarginata]|nr:hypothetical protein B0H14DRAFT_2634943 [Mycena olivaceomarginata]